MRGSIRGQTLHLLSTSGINRIGTSKFDAKNSARIQLAAEGRSATSQNIASLMGIHGIKTLGNYLGKWQEFGRYAKEEYGIRDLEKLTREHVAGFMSHKIEMGVKYSHWSGYGSALGMLENALSLYSAKFDRECAFDFRSAVESLRNEARAELPKFEGTRNYENPLALINGITNPSHRLAAAIQHQSGLRLAGATCISISQLRGLGVDKFTGRPVGLMDYVGKGGKAGTAQISPELYKTLVEHVKTNGNLKIGADVYRSSLKLAALATGQAYNGSHGLRWNYAQERFKELQHSGTSYEQGLGAVSDALGHNRIEITCHYLGL